MAVTNRSPRAWGWTVLQLIGGSELAQVPTRVGVDRSRKGGHFCSERRSPRAWGWTGVTA